MALRKSFTIRVDGALAGAVEILRFPLGSYFSGLASGATTVYLTPGEGI